VSSSGASSSSAGVGEKDGAALSSWARYLKNKYGARGKEGAGTSTISNSRRLSLGLPLRPENDEDQKNSPASPTSPTQHPLHQVGTRAEHPHHPRGHPTPGAYQVQLARPTPPQLANRMIGVQVLTPIKPIDLWLGLCLCLVLDKSQVRARHQITSRPLLPIDQSVAV
ncbi:unnamed protein product, partial [Nesidiocoris tenuis]